MSQFTTPLITEHLDGRNWRVVEPFVYHIGSYPAKFETDIIKVPADFVTDFASIPRMFWAILHPTGEYGKAAVIHDWLYRVDRRRGRKMADKIFLEGMKVLNVPRWKQIVIYRAVRVCGWNAWRKNANLHLTNVN